jgi:two-component system nitrogen regulation response regulator GlnG
MLGRASALRVLLLCADSDLQAQIEHDLKATVVVAKDIAAAHRLAGKTEFDAVLLEIKRGHAHDLTEIQRIIDPSRTLLLAGPHDALQRACSLLRTLGAPRSSATTPALCLEDYVESKLSRFFKDIKNGAARNLHPILIKAVERPLITLVLKETNGNQILAAHVLGLNRNTLRKKISEFRIPVKRDKNNKVNSSSRL